MMCVGGMVCVRIIVKALDLAKVLVINQVFDGRQRTLDEYTGEIIYYRNSKYSSSKQSNVDHAVPIKVEIDCNSWLFENEHLLADDTKDALNSSFNL